MVHAFRCDRCDEFYEGEPYEYKVNKYSPSRTSVDEIGVGEHLCADCGGEFEFVVREFFGGGDPDTSEGR